MIQKNKYSKGIVKLLDKIPFRDQSRYSERYFRLFDIPEKLYSGKNSFRINLNKENLVKGSKIYIDVIDKNGDAIYHEVSNLTTEDGSKVVVIYIYANTPPGPVNIYIAGRTKYNPNTGEKVPYSTDPGSTQFKDLPNIVYINQTIAVPEKPNNDELLFGSTPVVRARERRAKYEKIPSGSTRYVVESGSAGETLYLNSSKVNYTEDQKFQSDLNTLILDPTTDGASVSSTSTTLASGDLPVMESTLFEFTSDMVGGNIEINGIAPSYSGNIVSVIDKFTAEMDTAYQSGSEIPATQDFTMSYWTSDLSLATVASESFLQIEINDLEPVAGNVDKVRISYKPYGTFGDFINIGEIPLTEKNLLVSREEYQTNKIGLVEKEIGNLKDPAEYSDYWNAVPNAGLDLVMSIEPAFTFENGFGIIFSGSQAIDYNDATNLGYLELKDSFQILSYPETEYKLQFSARYTETGSANVSNTDGYKQVDIYISGSVIEKDEVILPFINNKRDIPGVDLGTYIGSISTSIGKTQLNNKIYFKSKSSGSFKPIFVFREGSGWEFKDMKITARNERGFSPNSHQIDVPIQSLKQNNELVVRLDYLNNNGIEASVQNELYGLFFSGSDSAVNELILTNLNPKEVLFGDATGSVGQSDLFLWDYDSGVLEVGDTKISTGSIGFDTRRLIIKRGTNEDLIISGTIQSTADGTNNIITAKSASLETFKINPEGVAVFGEFLKTPSPIEGGFMYSGSNFWVGL